MCERIYQVKDLGACNLRNSFRDDVFSFIFDHKLFFSLFSIVCCCRVGLLSYCNGILS